MSLVFILAVPVLVMACVGPISEVEYDALEALYDSTDGENWRWLPDDGAYWHFPAALEEPCGLDRWQGLGCNSTNMDDVTSEATACYVSDISLRTHNLVGTLPSSLGTLTRLGILDLYNNHVAGSLPTELGQMTSLVWLNLQDNRLSQQLPSELGALSVLEGFYLSNNAVHGTLPTEIGKMTRLFGLYLENNYLESSIPAEFGLLKLLGEIYMDFNYLSSTIPNDICDMTILFKFYVYNNLLSGSIPTCIGAMNELRTLSISENAMTGRIPTQLGDLANVLKLSCEANYFTGRIPAELYGLHQLQQLLLTANTLSGTILPTVASLASVYQFEIGVNLVSGAIPSELFTISGLVFLFLYYNSLSSTIPDTLFACTSLRYLYLDDNELVGTISNLFSNSSNLQFLTLSSNFFSGSIPPSLYGLRGMQELSVSANLFTGTVTSVLGNLSDLAFVSFSDCLLTGSFPGHFADLSNLQSFTAQSNYLSGPFRLLSSGSLILQDLEIGYNFLSGRLPSELSSFGNLEELAVARNLLTGKIDFLFDAATNTALDQLVYIDLSENAFSGTIPEAMFEGARSRPLTAVILYQNCFTGTLPSAVCQAGNLTTLILDSVSTAPACDVRFTGFWKDLFKVVIGKRSLQGTIPECIWSMRSLQTVHLAGNGLGGTLPANQLLPTVTLAASSDDVSYDDLSTVNRSLYILNDVNLASNVLTGTIPLLWQQWPWKSLDLSGNKLTGILSEGFLVNNTCSPSGQGSHTDDDDYAYLADDSGDSFSASNSSQLCGVVDLTVNRLSGHIPAAFRYAQGVNILDGNLFDCGTDSMPEYDPSAADYVCGSSDFNFSLVLWALFLLVGTVFSVRSVETAKLVFTVRELLADLRSDSYVQLKLGELNSLDNVQHGRTISRFLTFLQRVAISSLVLVSVYLCVGMLSYMGMKASAIRLEQRETGLMYAETYRLSTHTYQYAWLSTAAYMHGSLPVALVLVYQFLSLIVIARFLPSSNDDSSVRPSLLSPVTFSYRTSSTSIKLLHSGSEVSNHELLCETLLRTDINLNHAVNETESSTSLVDMPPTAPTRITWYTTMRLFFIILVHAIVMISINILYIYIVLTGLSSNFLLFLVQFTLSVFKLLWNRYYVRPVSRPTQSINSSLTLQCCSFMVLFTFVISPVLATFFSDDTCFRYFITGQSAVDSFFQMNVYACLAKCADECVSVCGFMSGAEEIILTSVVPSWRYSYQCSSSLLINYTPVLLYSYALTGVLVPLVQHLFCRLSSETIERYVPHVLIHSFVANTVYAYEKPKKDDKKLLDERDRSSRVFNGMSVLSRAYMNFGVLITFGLASPLLATAVCLDCVNLYFGWKALIYRYLSIFVDEGASQNDDAVERAEYLAKLARSVNVVTFKNSESSNESARSVSTGLGDTVVLWMVVWIAGLFWGLFVFDMYGDIYGAVDGLCMILAPTVGGSLVFYLASCRHRCYHGCSKGLSAFGADVRSSRQGGDTSLTSSTQRPTVDPQGVSAGFGDILL
jgi:Leucine-rich repeat (LRR) protein